MPEIAFCGITTFSAILLLRWSSHSFHLIDEIQGHKKHQKETAVIGGIAIILGLISLAVTDPILFSEYFLIINMAALMMISGILDDAYKLTSNIRLLMQVIAGVVVYYVVDLPFRHLGDLVFIGDVGTNIFALPFTLIAVSGGVNAVNMMDGLDGLAGGLVLITLCFLGLLAYPAGAHAVFLFVSVLATAILTFLIFNFRFPWNQTASVFMGDGGTYALGFILACLFLTATQGPDAFMTPILALWILAVPLIDCAGVIWRRLKRGDAPLSSGRDHIHHLLSDLGLDPKHSVLLLYAVAIFMGGLGVLGFYVGVSESWMFVFFLLLCTLYFYGTHRVVLYLNVHKDMAH